MTTIDLTNAMELASRAAAYEGGNQGEYLVDYYQPWILAMAELIREIAERHNLTVDGETDRVGSRYITLRDSDGEVIASARLSDHGQRYCGPDWSFEITDSEQSIRRGLAELARLC